MAPVSCMLWLESCCLDGEISLHLSWRFWVHLCLVIDFYSRWSLLKLVLFPTTIQFCSLHPVDFCTCPFGDGDVNCFAVNMVIALTGPCCFFYGGHFQAAYKDTVGVICGPAVLPACEAVSVCAEVAFYDFFLYHWNIFSCHYCFSHSAVEQGNSICVRNVCVPVFHLNAFGSSWVTLTYSCFLIQCPSDLSHCCSTLLQDLTSACSSILMPVVCKECDFIPPLFCKSKYQHPEYKWKVNYFFQLGCFVKWNTYQAGSNQL